MEALCLSEYFTIKQGSATLGLKPFCSNAASKVLHHTFGVRFRPCIAFFSQSALPRSVDPYLGGMARNTASSKSPFWKAQVMSSFFDSKSLAATKNGDSDKALFLAIPPRYESTDRAIGPISSKPHIKESSHLPKNNLFSELIGTLLSHVPWPDIAQAVNSLASYACESREHHWAGAKQVLRYPLATADHGLTYGPSTSDCPASMKLAGSCGSDHSGRTSFSRTPTTGYVLWVNGCWMRAGGASSSRRLPVPLLRPSTRQWLLVFLKLHLRKLFADFPLVTRSDLDIGFRLSIMVLHLDIGFRLSRMVLHLDIGFRLSRMVLHLDIGLGRQ
eukprot:355842-Chlamydomonas_euryale.AAC.4